MKKLFISFITLCAVSALTLVGLPAQAQDVRLGYCNSDELGSSIRAQGTESDDNELGAAIFLPKSLLKKYVGDTIYQISYANTDKVGSSMTVFIKTDLYSRQGIVQTVRNHKAGWNNIKLNKPYVIKGDEDIYVGYISYPNHIEADNSEILTMEYHHGGTPGADWYGMNGQWWVTKVDLINYDFCIRAYAKGKNKPLRDLGLDRVTNYDIIRQNKPTSMQLQITNYGMEQVDDFTIEASKDGHTFLTKQMSGVGLAHNEMKEVDIKDLLFPLEGNNNFTVSITQVNGATDNDASDNSKDSYVYSVPENAQTQPRNILFEEFTNVSNKESYQADSIYQLAVGPRNDVVWVKYHVENKLPEQSAYEWFYDNNTQFTPSVMLDRMEFEDLTGRGPAYFVPYNEWLSYMLQSCATIPSFATVTVDATLNDAHSMANVTAKVTSQVNEMPHQKSLRLTLLAIEDSVQFSEGFPKENNVVRKFINGPWGQQIDLSNYADSVTASMAIDPAWNAHNLHFVAYLSSYDSSNPLNCPVYNAGMCKVKVADGLRLKALNAERPQLFYDGKSFSANGGYKVLAVYNQSGQLLSNQPLHGGLYLVKVGNGQNVLTLKYLLK